MNASIIGPGALGAAHASILCKKGYTVLLAPLGDHLGVIPDVKANKNMLRLANGDEYPVEIGLIEEALQVDIIIIATVATGYRALLEVMSQHDLSKKMVVVLSGGAFGLLAKAAMKNAAYFPGTIVETNTSPYISRQSVHGATEIYWKKHCVQISACPSPTTELKQKVGELFDPKLELDWLPDLASIFMSVTKAFLHVGTMVDNYCPMVSAGSGSGQRFYADWATKSLSRIGAMDKERVAGAEALGAFTKTHWDFVQGWYGGGFKDYEMFLHTFRGYEKVLAPSTASHRYLYEDAKHVLMLMRDVINKAGVETLVMDETLKKAGVLMGEYLFETGLTLESLDLKDATVHEIMSKLNGKNYCHERSKMAGNCCFAFFIYPCSPWADAALWRAILSSLICSCRGSCRKADGLHPLQVAQIGHVIPASD